jgi:hypothetical protein
MLRECAGETIIRLGVEREAGGNDERHVQRDARGREGEGRVRAGEMM